MELLAAGAGLPPLEEHDAVGAAPDRLRGLGRERPRGLAGVRRAPVHGIGGLLPQQPRHAGLERAHEVALERRIAHARGVRRVGIAVVGDDVHVRGPPAIVGRLERAHEVRRDRLRRTRLQQDAPLRQVALQQHVGGEPAEVEHRRRIVAVGREARREDLVERAVPLRPEVGAPRRVERVDGAVLLAQPATVRIPRGIGEVHPQVAAELVSDVPHHHRRVVDVALGDASDELTGEASVDGGGGCEVLPASRPVRRAGLVGGQRLGVVRAHPRRRRGRCRGEVHRDAAGVQGVDDPVEPGEVPHVFGGLDARPGEDAEAHDVHTRLVHAADVVFPDLFGPLVGVVVGAVQHA